MNRQGPGRIALTAALALVAFAATAPVAKADDSQIRISEVYSDASAAKGDFVEFQLLADGQQFQSNHALRLYQANGAVLSTLFFPDGGVTFPESQRTVLLGWNTNPNADLVVGAGFDIPAPGGAACMLASATVQIDCVTWGTFSGAFPSVGTPASALNASQSLTRTKARGCASLMEAVDDTENSAADFSLAAPSPRNNFALPTEFACPPAPSGIVPFTAAKKKCKKKKHRRSAEAAKKRCKKK
jgi:hypothetical protein